MKQENVHAVRSKDIEFSDYTERVFEIKASSKAGLKGIFSRFRLHIRVEI